MLSEGRTKKLSNYWSKVVCKISPQPVEEFHPDLQLYVSTGS